MTNPLGLRAPLELPIKITRAAVGVTVVAVLVGMLSLVVRFRRARGTERQQLRWVALAGLLAALAILMALAGMITGNPAMRNWGIGVSFAVLPPAIGAAILRYRLYDLDRILSRTLAYGLLTVLLAGGYAVVVLGLGQLLGGDSSLVVAAATLAVAAMFQPARRQTQALVGPPLQPPPPRRRPHHRRVQRPPPRPGRPGYVDRRGPGRGRPDDAGDPGVTVAAGSGRVIGVPRG